MNEEQLQERIVIFIDIATDVVQQNELDRILYDPSITRSQRTGRGPLLPGWVNSMRPMMCAYKLAYIKFQMFGFQTKVENTILSYQRNLLTNFHKQVFCLMDRWYGMSMQDIRDMEEETKRRLQEGPSSASASSDFSSSGSASPSDSPGPHSTISSAKSAPATMNG